MIVHINHIPVLVKGRIVKLTDLKNDYYKITIEALQIAKTAKPGQFVMLSKWQIKELLLKRPFSFFKIEPNSGTFDILFQKVGKGTQILAESRVGEYVELIGPLGNGFNIPQTQRQIALVARGIGVAPLMSLARESNKNGIEIYSFLSARTKDLLLYSDEMKSLSKDIFYTTDDGSKGATGIVTLFLENLLEETAIKIDAVYTCGSKRLARHIKELQKKYHFFAYISLEERMGCGIGSCKGCVHKTTNGYQRVCQEGPVFPLEEVILNE